MRFKLSDKHASMSPTKPKVVIKEGSRVATLQKLRRNITLNEEAQDIIDEASTPAYEESPGVVKNATLKLQHINFACDMFTDRAET